MTHSILDNIVGYSETQICFHSSSFCSLLRNFITRGLVVILQECTRKMSKSAMLINSPGACGAILALSLSAHKTGQIHTQVGIPANHLKNGRDLHQRPSSARRLVAKFEAHADGKGPGTIEEGEGLEGLREHADVLEVDDVDFVRVEEEVLLLDVGVVDATTVPEGGRELFQSSGERWSRPEVPSRLWERIVQ